jgi:hypothetical protein
MPNITSEIQDKLIKILVYKWNSTTVEYSIAKTIVYLNKGNLYKKVLEDYERLEKDYSTEFMHLYKNNLDELNKLIDIDDCFSQLLSEFMTLIKYSYPLIWNNYYLLKINGHVNYLTDFCSDFKGEITHFYDLVNKQIIQTKRNGKTEYYFAVNDKVYSEVRNTIDQAIIAALSLQYTGLNSNAYMFIERMLELK